MNKILELNRLKKYYTVKKGLIQKKSYSIKAVDDVSFDVCEGETLGLVGESGCGKTTIGRLILRLIEPTDNTILFKGRDIFKASSRELKSIRRKMGIVFQDPAASLNPRVTIYDSLKRLLVINGIGAQEAQEMIKETIDKVHIGEELLERYPQQLSGGQQQRASIARAIMLKPEFLVLDEPTSALDVSVQAQILNVLLQLQQEFRLTYLFITHNLSVVRYISDRICVMYVGKIMEIAPTEIIYENPLHPYTVGLMASAPVLSPRERQRAKFFLAGDPPSLLDPPAGCRLVLRCPFCFDLCQEVTPELKEVSPGHFVACHRAGEMPHLKKKSVS